MLLEFETCSEFDVPALKVGQVRAVSRLFHYSHRCGLCLPDWSLAGVNMNR